MRIRTIARTLGFAIAAGAIALTAQGAAADGAGEEKERNRRLVAAGFQAWADGTGSPYDILAEDVSWTIAGNSLAGGTYPSKAAFIGQVIRPFNARMRDRLIPTVRRLYADGDTVIAHFDAAGVARDGKRYENSYAWILRMEDGLIVEAHAYFDALAFNDLWQRVEPAE